MDTTLLSTHDKGDIGEEMAVEYLLSKGYSIISRKYRSRIGEIDCIAKDSDDTMVFLEVKSAKGASFGNPLLWITAAKQKTIGRMARQYLYEHHLPNIRCRFDVITIFKGKVSHLKNAFMVK
jgi:putative endonuclease